MKAKTPSQSKANRTNSAATENRVSQLLEIPWHGLRPDLVLHPGPLDYDGQRSWVLEDPVRGNNYRLGYAEGELLFRLTTIRELDAAVANLYRTTVLRPAPAEIAAFIRMLQREHLAILPQEETLRQERQTPAGTPNLIQKLIQGSIFFRLPLIRPDRFLERTLAWVSLLAAPALRWFYAFCGLLGLVLVLQEMELYLGTASYLFTPQGGLAFFACLALLKIGHEFAHAYTAKAMGLHVRSMGIFFIVFWPLLYTDTTDVWKVPDRGRRMWVSAAGVLFELAVGGVALLLWALLPDGILRSLMFFLSGTSLLSSFLINLNPFMRYDGYYLLMDWWGIDNLRPRAFAMLRYRLRRLLLGWKGQAPEFHPHGKSLVIYGVLALLYRLFVGISIALAVYYLLWPGLGLLVMAVELWLFIIRPLWTEIAAVVRHRRLIGSKPRTALTVFALLGGMALLLVPLPRTERLPCLLLYEGASRIEAPSSGQLDMALPKEGRAVKAGQLLTRLRSDALEYDIRKAQYDLASVCSAIETLGSGGEEAAYRNWLSAEQNRLEARVEKLEQAMAQLEIRAPIDGEVTQINPDLYPGAFVSAQTYLLTVADPDGHQIRAYVHEQVSDQIRAPEDGQARVHFFAPDLPALTARYRSTSLFPVHRLPNDSLFDIAGGPIVSKGDGAGERLQPRDAYFTLRFDLTGELPFQPAHGMPARIRLTRERDSLLGRLFGILYMNLTQRGVF